MHDDNEPGPGLTGGGEPGGGRHRVAIVGAGFGGLFAAKALRRAALDVMVIDRTGHHLFHDPSGVRGIWSTQGTMKQFWTGGT